MSHFFYAPQLKYLTKKREKRKKKKDEKIIFTLGPLRKYGMASCALAAIIATESEGVTKKPLPRIIFLSPSPNNDKR